VHEGRYKPVFAIARLTRLRSGQSADMDAITLLKDDHKVVESLFKQFEKLHKQGGTPTQKKRVVAKIIEELSVHAAIEEEISYPDVKNENEEITDSVLESLEEHHIVKTTLSELQNMDPTDERYDAKVTVLIECVRHHVEEEEQEMFPEVRKQFGRKVLQEMGDQLMELKKSAPRTPHPHAPDEPPLNKVANRAAATKDKALSRMSNARSTTPRRTAPRT